MFIAVTNDWLVLRGYMQQSSQVGSVRARARARVCVCVFARARMHVYMCGRIHIKGTYCKGETVYSGMRQVSSPFRYYERWCLRRW